MSKMYAMSAEGFKCRSCDKVSKTKAGAQSHFYANHGKKSNKKGGVKRTAEGVPFSPKFCMHCGGPLPVKLVF